MTKPNKCTLCESSFTAKWSLTNHMIAIHEGKRPYQCSVCHMEYGHKVSLNKHVRITGHFSSESKNNVNENKCLICNIRYTKKTHYLTIHNASLHSMVVILSDMQRNFFPS